MSINRRRSLYPIVARRFSTGTLAYGRTQRQKRTPSPDGRLGPITNIPLAPVDTLNAATTSNKNTSFNVLTVPLTPKIGSVNATPGAGNSHSFPGHNSTKSNKNYHHLTDQTELNLYDNLTPGSGASGSSDITNSPTGLLLRKKNLSTSDLDPLERKKQAALDKVGGKLDKARRLHQRAQQDLEQQISGFLRITTIPNANNESNSCRITNAAFDKRIRTLQDAKRELEKKIVKYQSEISRIQAGDIPSNYSSSKDILTNIKTTAAKVAGGSLKHRSANQNDPSTAVSTQNTVDQQTSIHQNDNDHYQYEQTFPSTPLVTSASSSPPATQTNNTATNNQNLSIPSQGNSMLDATHSSVSSSVSNEVGKSHFYIDALYESSHESDKTTRKYESNIPADGTSCESEKSPLRQRRLTEDSNVETNDRASDHSTEDRLTPNTSTRTTPITINEFQQMINKIDSMQKQIDRYETKFNEMQKQIDALITTSNAYHETNELLNNEIADLTHLHQTEISSIKMEIKNLEERMLYRFNDYWNELMERLDKLDTRTAKVEQTQTHSFETEENTHRIISKLVNILLTVFAIILLLLSTIKNVVQSRIHAMTILILIIIWITFQYLPPNYFQTVFYKNISSVFKRIP